MSRGINKKTHDFKNNILTYTQKKQHIIYNLSKNMQSSKLDQHDTYIKMIRETTCIYTVQMSHQACEVQKINKTITIIKTIYMKP